MFFRGKNIDPIRLWQDYCEISPDDTGPFLSLCYCPNPDHANSRTPAFQINISRPMVHCVSGDTLVQTSDGLRRVDSLVGTTVLTVGLDGEYHESKWNSYGEQRLFKIELANGDCLYATDKHEWVVSPTQKSRWINKIWDQPAKWEKITTNELKGRSLKLGQISYFYYDLDSYLEGVRHGLVFGDGTLAKSGSRQVTCLRQYFDSRDLVYRYFKNYKITEEQIWGTISNRWLDCTKAFGMPAEWKELPDLNSDLSYLRGFIAGLVAADGHVTKRTGHWMVHQSDLANLKFIQKLAASAGISSTGIRMARKLNPWTGQVQPSWKLSFLKEALVNDGQFDQNLVIHTIHRRNLDTVSLPDKWRSVGVTDVVKTQRIEEVFCCVEPETHTFIIGPGYLSGNCFSNCGISGSYEHAISIIENLYDKYGYDIELGDDIEAGKKTDREKILHNKLRKKKAYREARKIIYKHALIFNNKSKPARIRNERLGTNELSKAKPLKEIDLANYSYLPKDAQAYLKSRKINPDSRAHWQIGFDEEAQRITIPVRDRRDRLKFIIRRAIYPWQRPAYLYSDDSFKSACLFGICTLDEAVVHSEGLIVVEGSLDTILMHQAGYVNTVGVLGAYISNRQRELIAQLRPKKLYLFFDNDAAGVRAIDTAARELAMYPLFVARYPKGSFNKDPASLSNAEREAAIRKAVPLLRVKKKISEAKARVL